MSSTRASHGLADWLWRVGIVSLLASTVVAFTPTGWEDVWVIGSWVPRALHVVGALLGIGVVSLIAGAGCRIVLADRAVPRPRRHWVRKVGTGLVTAFVLLIACPLTALIAWLDSSDHFTVLPERSATGCRLVVDEAAGSGGIGVRVYVVPGGQHRAREVGYYVSSTRLVEEGQYELTWKGNSAALQIPDVDTSGPWACST
ncbi:hypothetical protein [Kineococcus aurantiacus]|uniref:hypothetical protein n=1 Tax=Kineococcus aurantiacus TaxID=37633 RepID=UPI0031D3C405